MDRCLPVALVCSLGFACAPAETVSCKSLLEAGMGSSDGIYNITPPKRPGSERPLTSYDVFCDMTTDGGGWTMVYKLSAICSLNPRPARLSR